MEESKHNGRGGQSGELTEKQRKWQERREWDRAVLTNSIADSMASIRFFSNLCNLAYDLLPWTARRRLDR